MPEDEELRWIPLGGIHDMIRQEAIAEVLVTRGRQARENILTYDLPRTCQTLCSRVLDHTAPNLSQWAESIGVTVEPQDLPFRPKAFKLEPGPVLWRKAGFTALLIPLFTGQADIILVGEDGSEEKVEWKASRLLHLPDRGLKIQNGRLRFIYVMMKM